MRGAQVARQARGMDLDRGQSQIGSSPRESSRSATVFTTGMPPTGSMTSNARRSGRSPSARNGSGSRAITDRFEPARIIALGDSFHDRDAANRLDEFECAALRSLAKRAEWIWIEGNHDPAPPAWLGGRVASEIAIGGLLFRHE